MVNFPIYFNWRVFVVRVRVVDFFTVLPVFLDQSGAICGANSRTFECGFAFKELFLLKKNSSERKHSPTF